MFAFAHNESGHRGWRCTGRGVDDGKISQFIPFDITFIILITYLHYLIWLISQAPDLHLFFLLFKGRTYWTNKTLKLGVRIHTYDPSIWV